MKESTKQILKITLDINRTFHRLATRWDSEQLSYNPGTREDRITVRGRMISWVFSQVLLKAFGYHGAKIDGKKYYRYTQDSLIFISMIGVYWAFTRFSALLSGVKMPVFEPYDESAPIYWAL